MLTVLADIYSTSQAHHILCAFANAVEGEAVDMRELIVMLLALLGLIILKQLV